MQNVESACRTGHRLARMGKGQELHHLAKNFIATFFFTTPTLNFCKCLIEVKKLYLFFTTFIF